MSRNPQPWNVRVLSQPSLDSDPAFMITFDDAKYLFNCPENTTRNVIQRKYGFNKYRAIFLSQISSETSAGLPGFIMSLADSGTKELKILGPPGLAHFLASARFYLNRDNLRLDAIEQSNEPLDPAFEDSNLKVYAIPVVPSQDVRVQGLPTLLPDAPGSPSLKRRRSSTDEDIPAAKRTSLDSPPNSASMERRLPRLQKQHGVEEWRQCVIKRMFPGQGGVAFRAEHQITVKDLRKRLPTWKSRRVATSYLAIGPEYRGRFDVHLADSLGVKKGPDRAKLSKGELVISLDGKTITPQMVLGPSTPAAALLVIDCPSIEFIPGLLESPRLSELARRTRQQLHCVLHMAPLSVLQDPRYQEWMTALGPEPHHIIVNAAVCSDEISFAASHAMQSRLSVLDDSLFRIPWRNPKPPSPLPTMSSNVNLAPETESQPLNILAADHHIVGMRPLSVPRPSSVNLDESSVSTTSPFVGIKEKVLSELPSLPVAPGDQVSVSCLGTGSAMPAKYRNVSGLLLQIPGYGNVILDCGEGTWGQMQRHFGADTEEVLRNVKCIFLSHIHADHHMGIARVLFHRRRMFPPIAGPLYIICPRNAWTFLSEYGEVEDIGIQDAASVRFIISEDIEHKRPINTEGSDVIQDLKDLLGMDEIKTAAVEHRTVAFGLVLRHRDGWSVTYSGDTKPCQNLVNAGVDSTLLIHEATMSDDQVAMAEEKAHSTVGQAVDIAKRMRAQRLLLTHFSTRYPKVPVLGTSAPDPENRGAENVSPEVFVAFDLLHIRLGEFGRAERYLPNLEAAFGELNDEGAD